MIYSIFIIPLIALITGCLMYKYPPKQPNLFIGYRTMSSMEYEQIWGISNRFCGKIWMISGLIMLFVTLLIYILNYFGTTIFSENLLLIVIFCEIGLLLLSTLIVENKIKR